MPALAGEPLQEIAELPVERAEICFLVHDSKIALSFSTKPRLKPLEVDAVSRFRRIDPAQENVKRAAEMPVEIVVRFAHPQVAVQAPRCRGRVGACRNCAASPPRSPPGDKRASLARASSISNRRNKTGPPCSKVRSMKPFMKPLPAEIAAARSAAASSRTRKRFASFAVVREFDRKGKLQFRVSRFVRHVRQSETIRRRPRAAARRARPDVFDHHFVEPLDAVSVQPALHDFGRARRDSAKSTCSRISCRQVPARIPRGKAWIPCAVAISFRRRLEERTFIELVRFASADQPGETGDAPTAIDRAGKLRASRTAPLDLSAANKSSLVRRRHLRDRDIGTKSIAGRSPLPSR